ncbi:MAG: flagellar basal body P-ring formation protein FlgA [Alphaproteobacteria bacterium]|nr:flagellar basal body P-ring formation protein FlgA [Alphaproteobacteria bacterium]
MKTLLAVIAASLLLVGPAFADSRVVVPARDIPRGETIADSDLVYATVPPDRVRGGLALSMNELSGMQARRYLRAGELVRSEDVRHPVIVTKGSTVTMTFTVPGITLTAVGKAMSEGGLGESVTVLNPVSYRQITATVTGPGQVSAGSQSSTVALSGTPLVASVQN